MGIRSLNHFGALRDVVIWLRRNALRTLAGVNIHPTSSVSLSGRIVSGARGSISIDADTLVAFKTLLISRDVRTGETRPIRIGARSFVGGGAIVMPGVTIGDEAIVAAGAVVMDDVPDRTIVAGNPARVVRRDIEVSRRGRLKSADDNSRRLWR